MKISKVWRRVSGFPDMFPDSHVCRLGRLRALDPYSIDVYLCQESLVFVLIDCSELQHEMQNQCQKPRWDWSVRSDRNVFQQAFYQRIHCLLPAPGYVATSWGQVFDRRAEKVSSNLSIQFFVFDQRFFIPHFAGLQADCSFRSLLIDICLASGILDRQPMTGTIIHIRTRSSIVLLCI